MKCEICGAWVAAEGEELCEPCWQADSWPDRDDAAWQEEENWVAEGHEAVEVWMNFQEDDNADY